MQKKLRSGALTLALALAATVLVAAPAAAKTETTGTVAVTVATSGGAPIADTYVTITGTGWASGSTSASGVFTSGELEPGAYTVSTDVYVSGLNKSISASKTITIAAGTDSATTLTVNGVQAITGTVTAAGKPVTGNVSVEATNGKTSYWGDIKNGTYHALVAPGTYTVRASAPWDAKSIGWLPTYAGDTVRKPDAKKIAVSSETATVNIAAYTKLGSISGKVVDSKGKPVKGAQVWASAKNRAGNGSATTDSKGAYKITGLPADSYQVSAWAKNSTAPYVTSKVTAGKNSTLTLKVKKDATYKGKIVLTLKAPKAMIKAGTACAQLLNAKRLSYGYSCLVDKKGQNKSVTFDRLPAGTYTVTLSGANTSKKVAVKKDKTTKTTMTRAAGTTISGKLTDSKGKALKDAYVSVVDGNGTALLGAKVSSKGTYTVTGAVKGKYVITATPHSPTKGARTEKKATITGKKATVNIKLTKGATISGTILNSKGKPVAGVSVSVYTKNYSDSGWATTDAKGKYKVTGLKPGTYAAYTYDPFQGGYFHGKSSSKAVKTGSSVTLSTVKIKP